jgi:peroxiredoxin Q/BCP
MAQTGEIAPNFTLVSDIGNPISLSDFRGKRVVLYFYPKADTPGCTKQACAVRDVYPQIEAGDAVVIGISPDEPEALVKFREKYDLPFILLSDPDHAVAEAYGAWGDKHIIRSHFAVDEEGRLTEAKFKVAPTTTADLALEFTL